MRDGWILLVEFDDDATGLHCNLPGGGVELGESLREGLARELLEETAAAVAVGRLLLTTEYLPSKHDGRYGPLQQLGLMFECSLLSGGEPRLPDAPDQNQVAVRWLPLDALPSAPLYPPIGQRIIDALADDAADTLIERL